jgi:4-amino-4-deoxy-L-arabinose transferase-like glycosyltransferase
VRLGALLLALGMALAFLSKGLVGILIPGAVAAGYLLLRRDWSLLWRARPWWALLALAVLAAPWVVLVEQRNPGFAQFFFVHEQFARFLTRVHQRYEPDWFFVPVLLVGFMPWTPLMPAIVRRSWADIRAGDGPALLLALWVAFNFAFFSLSQSKLIPYILPLFPALSLMAGRTLALLESKRVWRALLVASAVWVLLALVALGLGHSPALMARLSLPAGPTLPAVAAIFLTVALATAGAAWLAPRRGALPAAALATFGTLLLVTALLATANQLPGQRQNERLVAAAAARLRAGTNFYCVDTYIQSVVYYLHRTCTLVGYRGELDFGLTQDPRRWIADLNQFADRWRGGADALAVIRPESYAQLQQMGLPMRVIYTAPNLVAVVNQ